MGKLKEFIRNDHIQAAFVSGLCIIILALFFKKVMHEQVPYLENAVPGFVFTLYEGMREKIKRPFWKRALPWNLLMLLTTVVIMLRHLL